jgi:tRNA pseudouridine55 synthase
MTPYSGFINLNKPDKWTSHDCVAKVRKLLSLKKVGHAGTLDPTATGVLPIAIGKATRLLQYLSSNKAYKATIRFGSRSTTDDLEGEIISSQACQNLQLDDIKAVIPKFIGKIEQIPPSYSAIQVNGKRLYELARKGEVVEAPPRIVEIFNIDILDWQEGEFPELLATIGCSGGTYIRSIARDFGEILQTGAILAGLERTESSGFYLTNSLNFTDLEEQLEAESFQPLAPDAPLEYLPVCNLGAIAAQKWRQGQRVSAELDGGDVFRIYQEDGLFLGVSKYEEGLLIPAMVFEPIS